MVLTNKTESKNFSNHNNKTPFPAKKIQQIKETIETTEGWHQDFG